MINLLEKFSKQEINDYKEIEMNLTINNILFDSLPIDFIFVSPEGDVLRINKLLLEELQLKDEIVVGRKVTSVINILQDKKNVLPQYMEELHAGKAHIEFSSNSFIHEPKRNISFLISGAMKGIYDKDGELVRVVIYFRNVIEERTQKHILNMALSRTQIFYWDFDMERNVMNVDPRYFEYLGISTKDNTLTMEQYADLMHPDDRTAVFEALNRQLHGNYYDDPVPFRLHRADGTWEWFEAQSTYLGQLSDLPYRVVGICMSTQKYKDSEEKLNNALLKAQRSDQLKSAFLANMSHEIRTPLNAIVGFSTLLAENYQEGDRDELEEYISIIESNSQLLMLLISDILDLSKIESNTMDFHFSQLSLNTLISEIYNTQKINMKNELQLIMAIPDEDTEIETDPARLKQVIINFINNAVKFTQKGYIRFGYTASSENSIKLFVEDTGCGMSEEVLARIFERFYKGNSFVQGTGLGLAICNTIVNRFGGCINVTSEVGKGTCFTVTLPLHIRS